MQIKEPGTGRKLVTIHSDGTCCIHVKDPLRTCPQEMAPVVAMALRRGIQTKTVEKVVPNQVFLQLRRAVANLTREVEALR